MDQIIFKTISKSTKEIFKNYKLGNNTAIICKYDLAILIIKRLITKYRMNIYDFDIHSPYINSYDKEYVILLSECGILVYKAYDETSNMYYNNYADIIYVNGDCDSKVLKSFKCKECYEFDIDPV